MIPEQERTTPAAWLFSRQGLRVKVRALLAAALLLLAGLTWAREARSGEVRDRAYRQVLHAARYGDVEGLIAGAEAFQAAAAVLRDDPREEQVAHLHGQALAWRQRLAASPALRPLLEPEGEDPTPVREAREAAFRELRRALGEGDHRAALESVERYLATPAIGITDERAAEVRRLYPEIFARWSVSQLGSEEERRDHIARFQALNDDEKEPQS